MNTGDAPDPRLVRQRRWLLAMGAMLATVLLAVCYVQWRQHELLVAAAHFQVDNMAAGFGPLETEQLRLQLRLQGHLDAPSAQTVHAVRAAHDDWARHVAAIAAETAARADRPEDAALLSRLTQVVAWIEAGLRDTDPGLLDAGLARTWLERLEALGPAMAELGADAARDLRERAAETDRVMHLQSRIGLALTLFQCLLLLVLAGILLRQVRKLQERRRSLQSLAQRLSAARLEAEAASRTKSMFLANMSHEIRTPFHGMLGMMSLLEDGGLTPRQASQLQTARQSAQHLLTILNDILDVSQLESGKLKVLPQTVDLLQLVAEVDALTRVQAQAKGLTLGMQVAPDVARWVIADPTRLKQILFNLLNNAIKFTPEGRVALDVTQTGQGRVAFAVSDTGIGIDAAMQGRLFQRFAQVDDATTRRATGAGLGLEISRDLARLMGGDLTVHSAPGRGSCFTATLPLPVAATVSTNPPEPVDDADVAGRSLRILVAEDHPVNRAYMEAVLEKLGHVGVFASDGASAVAAAQQHSSEPLFDVIFMDLHMPGMDGFAAARAIRALPGPRGRVPIVALTADAYQASRDRALESGMQGFLTKPAHLPQLREALRQYGGQPALDAPGASPLSPAAHWLDKDTVKEVLLAVPAGTYAGLLHEFFETRHATIAGLREAVDREAFEDFRDRAHALKGAALSLGLQRLGGAAVALQAASVAPVTAELQELLRRLPADFETSLAACVTRGLLADAGTLTPPEARSPT